MTKVESAPRYAGAPEAAPVRAPAPFLIQFWRSAVGKKWVMAITGIMLIGFVFGHMVGNLKIYFPAHDGVPAINDYAEWLRTIGYPALPETAFLWITRAGLLTAVVLHIGAAVSLTRMNHAARPVKYQSSRDYVAANYAARTMRWTGVIVLAFIIFHLLDLTWGTTNPDFVSGDVYDNVVASFQRVPVAIAYIVANLALAFHLFHGSWSMFQSLGWNNPRWNSARRYFAIGLASIIAIGNVSIPLLIVTGVVGK
ncbi:MAG: succinate dehydrogenase cytochrome b subunit [Actinomycetes bacterium]